MLLLAHLSVTVGFIKHPRFSTVLSEMNYRDRQPKKKQFVGKSRNMALNVSFRVYCLSFENIGVIMYTYICFLNFNILSLKCSLFYGMCKFLVRSWYRKGRLPESVVSYIEWTFLIRIGPA